MILICGGAGYIGSVCNYHLLKKGLSTIILDNLSTGFKDNLPENSVFIQGDMGNPVVLRNIFLNYNIDCVFHFGALSIVKDSVSDPYSYYFNNVVNTINLLSIMKEFNVLKIIFSSSAAVYGHPIKVPIDENSPLLPVNPYGKTKMMIEEILKDFDSAYGLKHVCLRYFNACGADTENGLLERHNPETHLIPLILQAAYGVRDSVSIFGEDYSTPDGTCIRDYIHVCDLAEAHYLAYKHLTKENRSEIINLGNGEGYSVKEVIDTVKRVTAKEFKVISAPRRPQEPEQLVACADKAMLFLGWEPVYTSLTSIIDSIIRVMKQKDHTL